MPLTGSLTSLSIHLSVKVFIMKIIDRLRNRGSSDISTSPARNNTKYQYKHVWKLVTAVVHDIACCSQIESFAANCRKGSTFFKNCLVSSWRPRIRGEKNRRPLIGPAKGGCVCLIQLTTLVVLFKVLLVFWALITGRWLFCRGSTVFLKVVRDEP